MKIKSLLIVILIAGCSTPKTPTPLLSKTGLHKVQTNYEFPFRFSTRPTVDNSGISLILCRILEARLHKTISESDMLAMILTQGNQERMAISGGITTEDITRTLNRNSLGVKWMGPQFGREKAPSLRQMKGPEFSPYWPIIAVIQNSSARTFVLVNGVDNNYVYVSDPHLGNYAVSHDYFSEIYIAIGVTFKRT